MPPSGWGQGLNLGLREGVFERAHETLRELFARARTPRQRHRLEPRRTLCARTRQTVAGDGASRHHHGFAFHRPPARDQRLAALRIRQRPPRRLARFPWAASGGPAGADDLDLEPDRRRRLLALQRRDAARSWRKTSSSISSHLGLGAHPGDALCAWPTASPSRRANGSLSTARAGGVSFIATRTSGKRGTNLARRIRLRARLVPRTPVTGRSWTSQIALTKLLLVDLADRCQRKTSVNVMFSGIAIFEMSPRST